ncbi:MAG TPA: hypothetical protein VFT42_07425 [Solirubrobacteraceae bacterium]|nr:hypothetical protein [Solirubrobacteraceae bacterium]
MRKATPLALTLLALFLLLPARAALASDHQLSIMMDDNELVYRTDQVRDQALTRMKQLGVDEVRVTLLWSVVADGARSTKARDRRFRKLGADNPKAYPVRNWDRYDRLARACKTLGIQLYFDITGPGPSWGMTRPPRSQRRSAATWMPKAGQFAQFVKAVGKRFSGSYKDENDRHQLIPRVSTWALWNEPNQGGWLTPQWQHGQPVSAMLFRRLYIAGRRALVQTGHGKDTILLGETAPLGGSKHTTRSPVAPKQFIRALFCVDSANRPLRGGAARTLGCGDFDKYGPLLASAYAHHPYTKKTPPTQPEPNPNDVTMANLGDLGTLLDGIASATGRVSPGLPLISTEYGYETNPPDPFAGIPLATQAQWDMQGDWLTFSNPRVIGNTQFLLYDVPPLTRFRKGSKAYWHTYQSGLFFANHTPKPSAYAYVFPLLVTGQFPGDVAVWGQLRFQPNGAGGDAVQIQWRPADGSAPYANVGAPIAVGNPFGYFTATVPVPPGGGFVRAVYAGSDPSAANAASPEQPVG